MPARPLAMGLRGPNRVAMGRVRRMIAALRRLGGNLWMVDTAFSGAFVDNVGTTPVTAYADLLGSTTDRLAVLGPELLSGAWSNSYGSAFDTFSSATYGGFTGATTGAKTGVRVYVPFSGVIGELYQFKLNITMTGATCKLLMFSNWHSGTQFIRGAAGVDTNVVSGDLVVSCVLTASGTNGFMLGFDTQAGGSVSVSLASASKVTGNHATQSAVASKPGVQRVPKRTRGPVNQLLWSWWGGGGNAPTGWLAYGSGATEGALLPSGMRQRVFTSAASQDFIYQTIALAANTTYTVAATVDANPGNYTNSALIAAASVPAGANAVTASGASVALAGGVVLMTVTTSSTAGNMLLRIGSGSQNPTTGSVTMSAPALFFGVVTAQQIIDNGGIPLTTTTALPNVLEWATVISFDGNNDFLTAGIATGNEGFMAAGVTFGAPIANNETVFSNGAGSATLKGVWFVRLANGSASDSVRFGVGNGTALTHALAPSGMTVLGVPRVIEGGWTASTVMVGVDGQTNSVARTGDATPAPNPPLIGAYLSGFHHLRGPMHAFACAPVLPDAATRKVIRDGIAALQGRTL